MNINNLKKLKLLLNENDQKVSELEFTKHNYDHKGNLIKVDLPTLTTEFCEIGLYKDEIYFIFIVKSKDFNIELFNSIKNKSNISIYGFKNFKKTLYPSKNFKLKEFFDEVNKDEYLQIQFDYEKVNVSNLINKYLDLIKIFEENKVVPINQIKINLVDKN